MEQRFFNLDLQIEISRLASAFSFFTHALQPQMLSVSDPRGNRNEQFSGFSPMNVFDLSPLHGLQGCQGNGLMPIHAFVNSFDSPYLLQNISKKLTEDAC